MSLSIRIALLFVLLLPAGGEGQTFEPPKLSAYATDLTGTLTQEEIGALNAKLETFAKGTSTQLLVLMVPTIGDWAVEEASLKVVELNKLGEKGKDNGVLLFISKAERKIRIEVGYGLEGALPDITSGMIIRHEIVPRFREGDYYGGIDAAVDAIMLATKGEYTAETKAKKEFPIGLIIAIIIGIFILSRMFGGGGGSGINRTRGGFFPPIGGGVFGRGGFGGGGFGGGGFGGGGFSGGGGSFGGGGASGSW